VKNLEENMEAANVHISEEDQKVIRKLLEQVEIAGQRYDANLIRAVNL